VLRYAPIFPLLLSTACGSAPQWYAPPPQRAPLFRPSRVGYGAFVQMGDPAAGAYIVQGFRDRSEGPWRWTHDHPVLRFWVPPVPHVRFTLDLTLPDQTFRLTGPVALRIGMNGKPFDRVRFDQPGRHSYSRDVPLELLHQGGENRVSLEPDRWATPAGSSERLGFVLTSAGFVE
jgi:hypothetical protein